MPKSNKVAVIGLDAMDPRLTRKYVDMGIMPNTKELIERGVAREGLDMLGALPTVTPAQWTTLATGTYPQTHDITTFFRQGGDLDLVNINFSSKNCKAEQLWNVTAEAGYKTLVWHWPGSAWPPSSDNPNLHVVDGSSPGGVNMSTGQAAGEYIFVANKLSKVVQYRTGGLTTARVPCVVTDLDENGELGTRSGSIADVCSMDLKDGFPLYIIDVDVDGGGGADRLPADYANSYIRPAQGWSFDIPDGALEFVLPLSGGLIRRHGLILQNELGDYDRIVLYENKKNAVPLFEARDKEYVRDIVDDCEKQGNIIKTNRDFHVLEISADGSQVRMWVSAAMDIHADIMWSPKSLFKDVAENVGYPAPTSQLGFRDYELIHECMIPCWQHVADFQADALNYLMDKGDYDVIFSHMHAIDLQDHMFIRNMAKGTDSITPEVYEEIMESIYKQADGYIGRFLHYLDEGWTIIVVSDHAQVCPKWGFRGLGDTGTNISLMEELGYTTLMRDPETGEKLRQIDWTKTTAVANREMMIYLNLKGRNSHVLPDGTVVDGLVDEADRYELEEQIMTDLYGYKDKESGKRIISLALRRKDAVILGLGGPYPECGDIVYAMAEGYEHDHADSLATSWGECDTSVAPIFIAAGPGFKSGETSERIVKQVDIAPTMAVLLDVRMPAQAEGAPLYQMME